MEYHDLVRDFAKRTLLNLDALERAQARGEEVFEVTQLINSLLGLLVFPRQEFVDRIPNRSLFDLQKEGWPIPRVVGEFEQVKDLRMLFRYLRNGVAHFNIKFTADTNGQLAGFQIWNKPSDSQPPNWKAELTLVELKELVSRFVALLLNQSSAKA